jgi:hypothetical protein
MKVTGYGDKFTEDKFKVKDESTFAMIKPDAFGHLGM